MADCASLYGTARFGGIEFEMQKISFQAGRRTEEHVFPFRDDHYIEDLGDTPEKWEVRGLFVGDDWRERMLTAKRVWLKKGAFDFYNPSINKNQKVVVVNFTVDFESAALNFAEFTLTLTEKGLEPYQARSVSFPQTANAQFDNYMGGVQGWYVGRYSRYGNISAMFSAYGLMRGQMFGLNRQYLGAGVQQSVTPFVSAMQPTRNPTKNFNRNADIFESVATAKVDAPAGSFANDLGFYRQASEFRITSPLIEETDQAHLVALNGLGYYFQNLTTETLSPTPVEIANFRDRAESLMRSVDDHAVNGLIANLLATLGETVVIPCIKTVAGPEHVLPLAYQLYGDINRAQEITTLSNGVSGARLDAPVYVCPA